MNNLKYIFSPCGTSLLTNHAKDKNDTTNLIFKYANKKTQKDVPEEDRVKLEALLADVNEEIETAAIEEAKKMSAELNTILQIYKGEIPHQADHFVLLSTDTWLGEQTAKLVEKWLRSKSTAISIDVRKQKDLQTQDLEAFQLALSELVRDLSKQIPDYRERKYRIIFNLTGGFKSVQGFLQSIAHFFADETVYIFESSDQLMRIPRLPIKLETAELVKKYLSEFRTLEIDSTITSSRISKAELEIFFLSVGEEAVLSPYGEIAWAAAKREIYEQSLLLPPKPEKVRCSANFEKAVKELSKDRIFHINKRIDQLCKHFADSAYNPASLGFKPLKGKPKSKSTHEMDAWADDSAKRLYGHFEGECFVIDELGKHL